jgi:thymidylate kinase
MVRYQQATEANRKGWLVIDEGFCQRGVALFSHGYSGEDQPLLASYLASVPLPEVVVMVDTPPEVCRQRMDRRGWSERVRDLDEESQSRFLNSAAEVVRFIAAQLERTTTRVIWVDGTMPIPDSVSSVAATLGG